MKPIEIVSILKTAFSLARQLVGLQVNDAVIVFRPGTAGQEVNLTTMSSVAAFVHNQFVREGTVNCSAGVNNITFTVGGAPLPFASANYSSVEKGRNALGNVNTTLVPGSKTAAGYQLFCDADCVVDYHAILNQ